MTCILRIRYDLEGALLLTVCAWLLLTVYAIAIRMRCLRKQFYIYFLRYV
jgi:hypothetical protein